MRLTPRQRKAAILVHVKGIPALAHVTAFERTPPMPARVAPSDMDAIGYVDIEYDLYDLKGYPAAWLERKLDRDAVERVEETIIDRMEA